MLFECAQCICRELKTVVNLNCQEILMEYLMFLLHNGKLDDAKQVTQVNSCYLIRKDMDVSECEIKVIRLIDWNSSKNHIWHYETFSALSIEIKISRKFQSSKLSEPEHIFSTGMMLTSEIEHFMQ